MDRVNDKTFAVLSLHKMLLSIAQNEIVNLDVASAVRPASEASDGSVGEIEFQGQRLPLFSLSEDLDLVSECPKDQNICVSIAVDGVPKFALSCSAVRPMQLDMDAIFPMPGPIADESGPLRGLVVSENSILFTSNAQALQNHIACVGDRHEW